MSNVAELAELENRIQQIGEHKENCQKMQDAVKRLQKNKDYKYIIDKVYLEEGNKAMCSMLARAYANETHEKEVVMELKARSMFSEFLKDIGINLRKAEYDYNEAVLARVELLEGGADE